MSECTCPAGCTCSAVVPDCTYPPLKNVGQILRADSAAVVAYGDFRIHAVPFG